MSLTRNRVLIRVIMYKLLFVFYVKLVERCSVFFLSIHLNIISYYPGLLINLKLNIFGEIFPNWHSRPTKNKKYTDYIILRNYTKRRPHDAEYTARLSVTGNTLKYFKRQVSVNCTLLI